MELGAGGEVGEGQATLALLGNSLMCGNARRGLTGMSKNMKETEVINIVKQRIFTKLASGKTDLHWASKIKETFFIQKLQPFLMSMSAMKSQCFISQKFVI